jgi:hypothetical protein
MRGEEIPQRGQLAVGAMTWAVIVRIPSLWVTAVISHPGKQQAEVGNVNAKLRKGGNTTTRVWQYTPRKPFLPEHGSCGRAKSWGSLHFIHTTVELYQSGACTTSAGKASCDSVTIKSSARKPYHLRGPAAWPRARCGAASGPMKPPGNSAATVALGPAAAALIKNAHGSALMP